MLERWWGVGDVLLTVLGQTKGRPVVRIFHADRAWKFTQRSHNSPSHLCSQQRCRVVGVRTAIPVLPTENPNHQWRGLWGHRAGLLCLATCPPILLCYSAWPLNCLEITYLGNAATVTRISLVWIKKPHCTLVVLVTCPSLGSRLGRGACKGYKHSYLFWVLKVQALYKSLISFNRP